MKIKNLKSHSDVAHAFATHGMDKDAYGEKGNMFFEGNTIYSYGRHFPIARFINYNTILFTLDGYSISTSKHISYVRGACSHLNLIYCYSIDNPLENYERFKRDIDEQLIKLARARKPEIYLHEIEIILGYLTKYLEEYLTIHIPSSPYIKDIKSLINKCKRILEDSREDVAKIKEIQKKEKERQKRLEKEKEEEFINGKITHFNSSYQLIRKEEKGIVTSKGVRIVDIAAAKRFQELLKENKIKKGDRFNNFRVSKIDSKTIQINCHTFKLDYLKNFKL